MILKPSVYEAMAKKNPLKTPWWAALVLPVYIAGLVAVISAPVAIPAAFFLVWAEAGPSQIVD